jgi:hypothetical protein
MSDETERLKGRDEQEMAAGLIAERALGAVAEPWDVDGAIRQSQHGVDRALPMPDHVAAG